MTLTQAVKDYAQRLGFALTGVTTPDAPPHLDVYERWLKEGRHGEMSYLATERARRCRADPREISPECRSILVLGIRYPAPPPIPPSLAEKGGAWGIGYGRVAAYAWGNDYHDILPDRLRSIVAFIETQAGHAIPNRWYTDTGPLLERELAQRAGLGWIGKNTCLIHPRLGSYFLLAEILLGIELDPDPPFSFDRCGTCTRCLDACPTGCILPDRTVDARRCISYLTIELKGSIPPDLRSKMGAWVFGCDVCQQVCPWNRWAAADGDPAFAPRPGVPNPILADELSLTAEDFNRKFKHNPVKRARRRGYLRNAAVAAGISGGQPTAPALARALRLDFEPLVRAHAAWALGRTGGEHARQALVEAASSENDPYVLSEINAAISDAAR